MTVIWVSCKDEETGFSQIFNVFIQSDKPVQFFPPLPNSVVYLSPEE